MPQTTSSFRMRLGVTTSHKAFAAVSGTEIETQKAQGYVLRKYKTMYGTVNGVFVPDRPSVIRPRIMIAETLRLSSFLGNYGIGKTLNTFTLLPGEKTRISIKTYRKTEEEAKQASSILDSFTQESSDDFENSVSAESSSKGTSSESLSWNVEAEASADWGVASASIKGGASGSTNSTREETAKNLSSATDKHAQKASAKRDVQVNTSSEVKTSTGEETEIVRELQNINVSRTLNFVFRQMNQEFISILHLTDIRLVFANGDPSKTREFTLPELDDMLATYIIESKRAEVKQAILDELLNIHDYRGKPPEGFDGINPQQHVDFIQRRHLLPKTPGTVGPEYFVFAKDVYSKYEDISSGLERTIQGIIIGVTRNVMRTDGVIVEAILGQGEALDPYSKNLQAEAIRERELRNDAIKAETERVRMGIEVVKNKDTEGAKLFEQVFPAPKGSKEDAAH